MTYTSSVWSSASFISWLSRLLGRKRANLRLRRRDVRRRANKTPLLYWVGARPAREKQGMGRESWAWEEIRNAEAQGKALGGGRPAMASTRPVLWEAVVSQGERRWRGVALGAAVVGVAAIVAVAATGRGGRPAHYSLLQAPPAMGLTSLALRGGDREEMVVAAQLRLKQQARLLKRLQSEDARLMRLDALPKIVQDMPTGGKMCVDKGGNEMRATM